MWGWLREFYEVKHNNRLLKLRLAEEVEERVKQCSACEILKSELATVRHEKQQLLVRLLNPVQETARIEAPEPIPVPHSQKPWRVRQQILEAQDRAEAQRIKAEFALRTAEAEKVMGIKDAAEGH